MTKQERILKEIYDWFVIYAAVYMLIDLTLLNMFMLISTLLMKSSLHKTIKTNHENDSVSN